MYPGMRVVNAYPGNGYDSNIEKNRKFLRPHAEYTIRDVEYDRFSTKVWLEEIRNEYFNSSHFVEKV